MDGMEPTATNTKKETVPVARFLDGSHQFQIQILRLFDAKLARFFYLNWHRRARKTTLALNLLIRESIRHKNRVYGYIAPTYTQAKAIIWRDPNMLQAYLPMEQVKRKNESELFVEFHSGSILTIKGADNPDSIRGMDFWGVALDEWALMKLMIWQEILRPIITQNPDRWAMFLFTPKGQNHAYDYWNNCIDWKGWHRSLLTTDTSGLISPEELLMAKQETPEPLYNQEYKCSFLADTENRLIPVQLIENLREIRVISRDKRTCVSCDPSEGGDECPVYFMRNYEKIDEKILHEKEPMKIAGEMIAMATKWETPNYCLDSIGIGSGIASRLREIFKGNDRIRINAIRSGDRKDVPVNFYNRRTQMWWTAMELIRDKKVPYPKDPELIKQLCSPRIFIINSNGKVQLEPKKFTKKELGQSPDRADTWVYGIWTMYMNGPDRIKESEYFPESYDFGDDEKHHLNSACV